MTDLKKNTIANFIGRAFTAAVGIVFVPLYVKYLGIESYGLVGFYSALLSVFALLNNGIGATLTRELARLSGLGDKAQQQRDLLRTLELIFWGLSLLLAMVVVSLAAPIANHWVNRQGLSAQTVSEAVRYMGMVMAFEFASSFYQGGLMGVQRQVVLNVIRMGTAFLRSVGVIGVLAWVSPTIGAFFAWNLLVGVLQAIASGLVLWFSLPPTHQRSRFRMELLESVWRYTAGIIGINLTVVLLMQMDKVILSKFLSLDLFGYYTLAGVAAGGLYVFIFPLYQAIFPRLSQLYGSGDQAGLSGLYHFATQMMSVLVLPAAGVVVFFSRYAMLIWTGDPAQADHTYVILAILIAGTALDGLMSVPYGLQLASGWTKLGFATNLVTAVVSVPALVLLVKTWGGPGAAIVWVMVQAGRVFVQMPIMHTRIFPGQLGRWYFKDVGLPLAGCLIVLLAARWIVPQDLSRFGAVAWLGPLWIVVTVAAALMSPGVRARVLGAARILVFSRGTTG